MFHLTGKNLLFAVIIISLSLFFYCHLSRLWITYGGSASVLFYFEFPVLSCLAILLYFNPNKKAAFLHLLPPLLLLILGYIGFDLFYTFFQRIPIPSDILNYHELFKIDKLFAAIPLLFLSLLLLPIGINCIKSLLSKEKKLVIGTIIQLFLTFSVLLFLSSEAAYQYQKHVLRFQEWSTVKNIENNGRLASFVFYSNKKKRLVEQLNTAPVLPVLKTLYPKKIISKPDIYLVVLESFFDPRDIEKISFNQSPLYSPLRNFLLDGKFSYVHSPVYGGATAQSEFELLTGIPAFALFESIEFNVFSGRKTSSFVTLLNENGYRSRAFIATEPGYYNSEAAYKGVGFHEVYYQGSKYLQKHKNDEFIYDGDLLESHLQFIEQNTPANEPPNFHYLLGMYGHFPFKRNQSARPDVIAVIPENKKIERIANQFYYRTKALQEYLRRITNRQGRDSIIIIVGDHLPPIFNREILYKKTNKTCIGLFIKNGKAFNISGHHFFEIPRILYRMLAGGKGDDLRYVNEHEQDALLYRSFMREAVLNP